MRKHRGCRLGLGTATNEVRECSNVPMGGGAMCADGGQARCGRRKIWAGRV